MAIDPANDIIIDVIRAADPQRATAAAQRLYAIGNPGTSADFATTLDETVPAPARSATPRLEAPGALSSFARLNGAGTSKAESTAVNFEAVLINNFIGEMLPKDKGDFFGAGLAGDMWKSMLADQISRQIAKSGELGIGKRLFATHPIAGAHSREQPSSIFAVSAAAQADISVLPVSAGLNSLLWKSRS